MTLFAVNRIKQTGVCTLAGFLICCAATSLRLSAETPGASGAMTNPYALTSVARIGSAAAAQVSNAPCELAPKGSPYIPLNFWMYPAMVRLYSLGYLDSAYLGLRPWTRLNVVHMLENTSAKLEDAPDTAANEEARGIFDSLMKELNVDAEGPCGHHHGEFRVESTYSVERGISGTPLHDSYHLGQSIVNDYGRPIESGFNDYSGASGYLVSGPWTLYLRTELQYAPSATGYSYALYSQLSQNDGVPAVGNEAQATIPLGPIATKADMRLLEGYLSVHVLGHDISFGKNDQWWGPAASGSYAWSNNAQNIYGFEINRTEPLRVPLLSRITGPFRYEFIVGSLKGHTLYNDPWVHAEKISMKPTRNFELGFERTAIWGGEGHVPITLHTFLKSFFSFQNVSYAEKISRSDPGARFGAFDASYRLPFLRNWLTFIVDSDAHDDVSPVSAPRRAVFTTGLYLSHVPGLPKLDLRGEAIMDDQSTSRSIAGQFMYYEGEVRQGYTNQGQIFGHWMGREAKGGEAWSTWHFNPKEWITVHWRGQKNAKDFIQGGTTLNDFGLQVVKRIRPDIEFDGKFTYEGYKAPIYKSGLQTVTATTFQITWFPTRKVSF